MENILDSSVWKQGESKYWTGIIKKNFTYVGGYYFLAALAIAALYTKYITRSILKVSEVAKKWQILIFEFDIQKTGGTRLEFWEKI